MMGDCLVRGKQCTALTTGGKNALIKILASASRTIPLDAPEKRPLAKPPLSGTRPISEEKEEAGEPVPTRNRELKRNAPSKQQKKNKNYAYHIYKWPGEESGPKGEPSGLFRYTIVEDWLYLGTGRKGASKNAKMPSGADPERRGRTMSVWSLSKGLKKRKSTPMTTMADGHQTKGVHRTRSHGV